MDLPKRKPARLKGYDYSQDGAYFITICTQDREELFWNVGETCGFPYTLSAYGDIVNKEIMRIVDIYNETVKVDKYVVMPNHIHLIIVLQSDGRPQVAPTISRVVKQFKGAVSKKIGFTIWQKSFHDHIIRNENDYREIWEYIDTNPLKWEEDCFYQKENR